MDPDLLVCASCGGRVSQARCATCRAALRELRDTAPALPAAALLWAAAALTLLLLVLLALQH